ncbi:DUF998 domain-containing protein [Nocardia sp. IFM 10818]
MTVTATTTSARRLIPAIGAGSALFITAGIIGGLTRAGFDMVKNPLSQLSTGDLGWLNIANFVVSGLLMLLGAYGLREVLRGQPAGTWGPRWIALNGVGLIAGGVFVTDPAFGYPDGAPALAPDTLSWHGWLHAVAPIIGMIGAVGAMVAFALRWRRAGHTGLAVYTVLTMIVYVVGGFSVQATQNAEGYYNFIPLWITGVIAAVWMIVLSARVLSETRAQ